MPTTLDAAQASNGMPVSRSHEQGKPFMAVQVAETNHIHSTSANTTAFYSHESSPPPYEYVYCVYVCMCVHVCLCVTLRV